MDLGELIPYWGAVVAILLFVIVLARYCIAVLQNSRWRQLKKAVTALRAAARERKRAERRIADAEKQVSRMERRAEQTRPRFLTEARGALEDARALARIADDKWMVAANHVRRVIVEEYPPHRHERLRARYLPDDGPDGRPFSF